MASVSNNPPKSRKRVEADTPNSSSSSAAAASLKRAKDGSAFTRCEECKSSVAVALIDMHDCSLEAKIKMSLDATVVEKQAEVKKKPAPRKKSASSAAASSEDATEAKGSKKRKLTKVKDPNMPKRPLSSYFLFLEDFRKTYKEEHPDSKGIKELAKDAGAKWKAMTDEEKKPYSDRAAELKAEHEKAMVEYNAQKEEEETADVQAEELCDEDA